MAIELMTEDELTFIRRSDASEDFEKMIKNIEEFRNIKKRVNKKGNLRAMKEEENPEEEPDEECEEEFDRWAQDPTVTKDQLLAAIGKGNGKGGKFSFRGKGGGKGKGQRPYKPLQPNPSAPTGARTETRSCYNCGEVGHLGKDCPLPDKRKAKPAGQRGTAKSLSEQDADGFTSKGRLCLAREPRARGRLCMLKKKETFEDLNRFDCLKPECANECGSREEDPTASCDEEDCYPEPNTGATKSKKKRMKRIFRKSQRQMHREAKDALVLTRDEQSTSREPKRVIEKDSIPKVEGAEIPEIPIPDPSFQRPSRNPRVRAKVQGSKFMTSHCNHECECEERVEAQEDSEDETEAPGLEDSDDEEDIPQTSDEMFSPKQLARRELRLQKESHHQALHDLYIAMLEREATGPDGSSDDSPHTTDDARRDQLLTNKTPKEGPGETHHSVER